MRALKIAASLFAASSFSPFHQTRNIEFVNLDSPIVISISKTAPQRAALEDLKIEPLSFETGPEIKLIYGRAILSTENFSSADFLKKLSSKKLVSKKLEWESQLRLPAFVVERPKATPVLAKMEITKREVLRDSLPVFKKQTSLIQPGMSAAQQARAKIIQEKMPDILNQDWSAPTYASKLSEAVQTKQPSNGSPSNVQNDSGNGQQASAATVPKNEVAQNKYEGHIEIEGGLAYTGSDDSISIFHQVGNQILAEGAVSIVRGDFEISVQQPGIGALVAELRNKSGVLMGKGEILLARANNKADRLTIKVKPVSRGVRGQATSAYSFGTYKEGVPKTRVAIEKINLKTVASNAGHFSDQNLGPNSSFIVRAKASGHWGMTALTNNDSEVNLTLFSNTMMSAFFDIMNIKGTEQQKGVIWGKVTIDGKPVKGAKVTMDDTRSPATYFNNLQIPSSELEATSENGLFAFSGLDSGLHIVRTVVDRKQLPTKVLMVNPGSVTYAAVSSSREVWAELVIYDSINGKFLPSNVNFFDSPKTAYTSDGTTKVRFAAGDDLVFLDVRSGPEYLPSRVSAVRKNSSVLVPMVSYDWAEKLALESKIVIDRSRAMASGYFIGKPYRIFTDDKEAKVIYFDNKGSLLAGNEGAADGGFVIFNLESGLKTLVVEAYGEEAPITKVILADPSVVSVLTHRF